MTVKHRPNHLMKGYHTAERMEKSNYGPNGIYLHEESRKEWGCCLHHVKDAGQQLLWETINRLGPSTGALAARGSEGSVRSRKAEGTIMDNPVLAHGEAAWGH